MAADMCGRSSDGRRAEKRRKLLGRCPERALREGDGLRGVSHRDVGDSREGPDRRMLVVQIMRGGNISSVGGVLQHVVAAGGVSCAEKQAGSADEFVCAVELGTVTV
eukprot:2680990-Pleurochrysis_carterae.AAC.2